MKARERPSLPLRGAVLMLATVLAAGCTTITVEEEPGSVTPGSATFRLSVRIVSADDPTAPIAGATIDAGAAVGATRSNTTGADGVAVLTLASPQVLALEATAPGHVAAGTNAIRLGPSGVPEIGQAVGTAFACAFSFGLACPQDVTTRLAGDSATITLRLVPTQLTRDTTIPVSAAATPPTQETMVMGEIVYHVDPVSAQLLERSAARADLTLAWTNAPGAAGDFDVAIGCGLAGTLATSQSGGAQTLLTLGERSVSVGADLPEGCGPIVPAVVLRSANNEMSPALRADIKFRPSIQIPHVG